MHSYRKSIADLQAKRFGVGKKTDLDAMDDGALEHPVHGTKVDTSKRIDIPYDSWTVDTWLSRMRLFVDVWCRAYGQRHKLGLSDCLDCLRDRLGHPFRGFQ